MQKQTIAVVCNNFDVSQKSGYNTAMGLYDALSEKYNIKIIVPLDADIYSHGDCEKWINPNMSVIYITPSFEFTNKVSNSKAYLYFQRNAHKDTTLVEKLVMAIDNTDIIICNTPNFVGFIRNVFPDKTIVFRSLDILYDQLCQKFQCTPLSPKETVAKREKILSTTFEIEKIACDSADFVLTLTKNDEDRLIELYGLDTCKIVRVPICFRDADRYVGFVPKPKSIGNNYTNCLFISYLFYDPERIARRIVEISPQLPEVIFHIVGSVGNIFNLNELPNNVLVYGVVDDNTKRKIFNKCDFALNIPSQTYGMNVKVMDYFAVGIPVLSNILGVRGYDVQENIEFIAASYDDLVENIRAFVKMDAENRYRIALNAFEYIIEKHKYEIYLSVLEKKLGLLDKSEKQSSYHNMDVYIFGAGEAGRKCVGAFQRIGCRCLAFVDNNPNLQGHKCLELEILPPEAALSKIRAIDAKLIIAIDTPRFLSEIYRQVCNILTDDDIIIFYHNEFNPETIDRNKLRLFGVNIEK